MLDCQGVLGFTHWEAFAFASRGSLELSCRFLFCSNPQEVNHYFDGEVVYLCWQRSDIHVTEASTKTNGLHLVSTTMTVHS